MTPTLMHTYTHLYYWHLYNTRIFPPFKTVPDKSAEKVIVHKEALPAHSLTTPKAPRVYEGSNNLDS